MGGRRIGWPWVTCRFWVACLGLWWWPLDPALAQPADSLSVEIVAPAAGEPLFGDIVIEAKVHPDTPLRSVHFELDGHTVATFEGRAVDGVPFRARVNVGDENREHRIRVEAHGQDGARGVAELVSPAIHVDEALDLELQQLYISVMGLGGRRVTDLTAGDFSVFDEGRRQEIVTFEHGDLPLTVMLLVDGSHSMHGERLDAARSGAGAFLGGLAALDEARLLVFADRILQLSELVQGGQGDLPTIDRLRTHGGSAVNDHLYLALQWLESRQGRRVVLLLSDGVDNHSVLRAEQVREIARKAQAQIYWVRLRGEAITGEPRSAWRDQWDARQEFQELERAVRSTGGRIFTLDAVAQIEPAFRVILEELREQYAVGYYPDNVRNDGRWRPVEIDVRGRGLRLRTREGYFDH